MTINPFYMNDNAKDPRSRYYITPTRIVWKSNDEQATVEGEGVLLEERDAQSTLTSGDACILRNKGAASGILLDFGTELQGGIQICAWRSGNKKNTAKMRVRFGESAMEAMSDLGGEKNATNDHAIRDQIIEVCSFLGMTEVGNSGFRFVRIDLLDEDNHIELKSVRAVALMRDIEYKGSFRCSDPLLEQIWITGAYTVHLNMQEYLWDGIKRDRLVWIGDMHPETSTIQYVFGFNEVVPKSLDLIRDETPLPGWMNSFPSYSMWWILIHHDWYKHNGDIDYLSEQKDYLIELLSLLVGHIAEDGSHSTPSPFLDWPSSPNEKGVEAGIHALFILTMAAGAKLCSLLGESETAEQCRLAESKLRRKLPDHAGSKQAAALMVLAGLLDPSEVNREVLAVGGSQGISTFLGYYVLRARGEAGDIQGSLACIREYWGGMLTLGATTFWEDFDISWLENAARIDELTPPDKIDVHGQYGNYCYKGYRHSLCHGWASGPTAWLMEYVLGIRVVEAGGKVVEVKPQLGDLEWAEGSYPTPHGVLYVRHDKQQDGSIVTKIESPPGLIVNHG